MNYIESVEIEGFWDTKKVFIKLHDDLNFLIGPNGSGKTTIINLISAVLRADIPALYAVQFKKVTVRLKTINSTRKPVIEVEKVEEKKWGVSNFSILSKKSLVTRDQGTELKGLTMNEFIATYDMHAIGVVWEWIQG